MCALDLRTRHRSEHPFFSKRHKIQQPPCSPLVNVVLRVTELAVSVATATSRSCLVLSRIWELFSTLGGLSDHGDAVLGKWA